MPGKIPFQLRNATPKIGDPPVLGKTKNWEPTQNWIRHQGTYFLVGEHLCNRWEWQLCIHRTLKLCDRFCDVRSPEILVGCFNQFEKY